MASPFGFAESTQLFLDERLIPAIRKSGVEPVNPWDVSPQITKTIDAIKKIRNLDARQRAWEELKRSIGETNARAIENADGMVAILDGVDVDSGTAAETGYAAALGKWIIGYRGDLRRTGEDETAVVNL